MPYFTGRSLLILNSIKCICTDSFWDTADLSWWSIQNQGELSYSAETLPIMIRTTGLSSMIHVGVEEELIDLLFILMIYPCCPIVLWLVDLITCWLSNLESVFGWTFLKVHPHTRILACWDWEGIDQQDSVFSSVVIAGWNCFSSNLFWDWGLN